jgi:thiol-disulfide isomerase/thioredoxin
LAVETSRRPVSLSGMKSLPVLLLAGALVVPALAADTPVIPATDAAITAPFVVQDGAIGQPRQTELAEGGRAVFAFRVAQAGDYVVRAVVDAPAGNANSFFVNIDAPPENPGMIWDITDRTDGFQERTVSWRGKGDAEEDEFTPKVFQLTAGEHRLIIGGREPARLRSVVVLPYVAVPPPLPGTLAAIIRRYEETDAAAERDWHRLPNNAEHDKKARELWTRADAAHAAQFMEAVRLAEAHPRSPEGLAALKWVLTIVRSHYHPAGPRALVLLREQYVEQTVAVPVSVPATRASEPADATQSIAEVVALLAHYLPYPERGPYDETVALLQAVLAQSGSRFARAHAALGLAYLDKRRYEEAVWRGEPASLARATGQVVQAFEAVVRDYADCPTLRAGSTGTVGEEARGELFEIQHLGIGQVAPEIEGRDLDGAPLKLSDYRGKVVLLVFWAGWCGPCMADVPHEKELVERFKGRPFVLLGVNGDTTTRDALKAVKEKEIPWRSFWNGPDVWRGPIANAWNISGWPTVYVLDESGVIRQKYLRGQSLDEPLEKLVTAAERRK